MHQHDATWGIVLAGGEGRRLQSLTRDEQGRVVPKQFCSFLGTQSLLRSAIDRMAEVVERQRIIVVVAASHRRWWQRELVDIEPENILVQPVNRGTACGVLLPLAHLAARDPEARVVVAPSDHFVEDEPGYASSLQHAVELPNPGCSSCSASSPTTRRRTTAGCWVRSPARMVSSSSARSSRSPSPSSRGG
jgi:mannose-1-phosphate guanylyltransferase